MYICALCGCRVGPNVPLLKRIAETRSVRYPRREEVNCIRKDGKLKYTDDPGGVGREIVEEQNLCPDCFASAM